MALGAVAVVALAYDPGSFTSWSLLAVPLIVFMGYFPMLIGRTGGGIEIGLDSCVLIFLANVVGEWNTLAVWFVGTLICQLLADKRRAVKAFNIGLGAIAGGLAVLVIHVAGGGAGASASQNLYATAASAAVYFMVDYLLSAMSLSLEEGTPLFAELAPRGALAAFFAFIAIASLGLLGALVWQGLEDGWLSTGLLAVPVVSIMVASRALSRGAEHARRLKVLFDTLVQAQGVTERTSLLEALRNGASDLLHDHRVTIRGMPPGSNEIGVRVGGSDEEQWIVAPALNRERSTANHDQAGLDALVAVADDALERLRLGEAMAYQAWHDSLTGLANRSLFMDRVGHAMEMQSRSGHGLAILFCDLDGFKRVNDMYGHAAGDALLAEVGQRIRSAVRETDTVARLGGDEFAVLLEAIDGPEEIELACQRILAGLRAPFHVLGEDVSVTTTIGVATAEPDASADSLVSRADLAMYHGKALGKNRFESYRDAFGDQRTRRLEFVESLRKALVARSLEVFYQPIVDLELGRAVGVEALVRWRRNGVLMPAEEFILAAEESGLVVALGDLVLDMVAVDAPILRTAAGQRLSVAVNVSAQQLHRDGFVEQVESMRARMGDIDLVLEVTERDFVDNEPRTSATMEALAASGVRFAIDDFGVGFSSLEYLQRLPVHILKVDKTFLTNIEGDSRACTLVRSMVVMGEALGLEVIVEGVERSTQLPHVTAHAGALTGQGYLFGMPAPLVEMVEALSDHARDWVQERPADHTGGVMSHGEPTAAHG
jgi:diguanylate cyclase (GGDEF)-like protein